MDAYELQAFRIAYEVTSAVICIILVRFMIKPYQFTKESRYLGLPLGFGFLGATYAISAIVYYQPYLFGNGTIYFQVILRSYAFVFLCVTYYFSRKSAENSRRKLWNVTLVLLLASLLTFFVITNVPVVALPSYSLTSSFTRIFNLVCLVYLCAHTLRSHIEKPDPGTLWTPFGYIFLAVSQYALIIYALDASMSAWWSALAIRWIGLAIFLIISCKSFHCVKRGIS